MQNIGRLLLERNQVKLWIHSYNKVGCVRQAHACLMFAAYPAASWLPCQRGQTYAGQQGGEISFLLPYDFDWACVAS